MWRCFGSLGSGHVCSSMCTWKHTFTQINNNYYNLCTDSASHSTLYKVGARMSFLATHTFPSHNPSPRSDFTTQTVLLCLSLLFPFLSVFMDQWREQLHQRRSGGLEMKSCVAVGKHLATVRGAGQEQEEEEAGGEGGDAAQTAVLQVLQAVGSLEAGVCGCWGLSADGEQRGTDVRTRMMWVCLFVNHVWVWLSWVSEALKQPPITIS